MKQPSKLVVATEQLNRGGSLFMNINTKKVPCGGIPSRLMTKDQVVLQIGWDMPIPIKDLALDEHGFYGTLIFDGTPEFVSVPWEAVWAMVNDYANGMIWGEDVPPTIADKMAQAAEARAARDSTASTSNVVSMADFKARRGR